MIANLAPTQSAERSLDEVINDLVRVRRTGGGVFVNLPMIYPDGSFVTVRIDQTRSGFRVSDCGFTFREVEDLGGARSFTRSAKKVAEDRNVLVGDGLLIAEADIETLERAICDLAEVSWRVVDTYFQRSLDEDDGGLSDELNARLERVFGSSNVEAGATIVGASTTPWPISARVKIGDAVTVFQAVSDNANSINRASTAFRDFSALDNAPKLVAFVKSKAALGPRLGLLVPGRIIEESQGDEVIAKAAA